MTKCACVCVCVWGKEQKNQILAHWISVTWNRSHHSFFFLCHSFRSISICPFLQCDRQHERFLFNMKNFNYILYSICWPYCIRLDDISWWQSIKIRSIERLHNDWALGITNAKIHSQQRTKYDWNVCHSSFDEKQLISNYIFGRKLYRFLSKFGIFLEFFSCLRTSWILLQTQGILHNIVVRIIKNSSSNLLYFDTANGKSR